MYADVVLPNVGFGMEEGRLIAWLKNPGDAVRKGEPIAEIEGDKTTVELESTVDGVLDAVLVPGDSTVAVGTVLARIRTGEAESAPAPAPAADLGAYGGALPQAETAAPVTASDALRASPVAQRLALEHGINLASVTGTGPGGKIIREDVEALIARETGTHRAVNGGKALAAPAVRKLARDNAVNLDAIRGTGEGGRVTRADVEMVIERAKLTTVTTRRVPDVAAAIDRMEVPAPTAPSVPAPGPTAASPAPAAESTYNGEREEIALSRMRLTIAERLSHSYQTAPHFFTTAELDLTDALAALPKSVGVNALLLALTVQALKDVPALNATFEDGHLYSYPHVNLAMAVALPNGLITPVLHRADDFSLTGIAERSKDLVTRARDGKLKPDEMRGGTFTVSNLGIVQQIERFTAIINPPQVGILAIGAAKDRPVVINRGLHIRTTAYVTLSADHRIVDGLVAARFLEAFDNRLQQFGK